MVALIEFVKGFDHPARRIQEAFAVGVFADVAKQGLHRLLGFDAGGTRLIRAYSRGQKFGRIQFGGTAFRNLRFRGLYVGRPHVGRLAWA
jgi:hypothetical protein